MQIINYWITHIDEEHTAASISEQSHDYTWDIAEQGAPIPYEAVFATRTREPEDEELEWARKRARELGLP